MPKGVLHKLWKPGVQSELLGRPREEGSKFTEYLGYRLVHGLSLGSLTNLSQNTNLKKGSWAWWHIALNSSTQAEANRSEFKASLVYTVSSSPARGVT